MQTGRRHAQLGYFMPANSERAEGGNRIKLSKDAQRMRVMQMQKRLVSVCLSVCLCVCVSALPGMPHLAFNQKQTANSQQATANRQRQWSRERERGQQRRRRSEHSMPHTWGTWGTVKGLSPFCSSPANRCGRGHGLHSATVYFSFSALFSFTLAKLRRNHKRNRK